MVIMNPLCPLCKLNLNGTWLPLLSESRAVQLQPLSQMHSKPSSFILLLLADVWNAEVIQSGDVKVHFMFRLTLFCYFEIDHQ